MSHRFSESEYENAQPDLSCSSIESISKATLVRRTSPARGP